MATANTIAASITIGTASIFISVTGGKTVTTMNNSDIKDIEDRHERAKNAEILELKENFVAEFKAKSD